MKRDEVWASVRGSFGLCALTLTVAVVALGCGGVHSTSTTAGLDVGEQPNAGAWVKVAPPPHRPHPRVLQSAVYVDSIERVLVFGGGYQEATGTAPQLFNDLWSYDPVEDSWQELHPSGVIPCARWRQRMVYDPDRDRILMYGGDDGGQTADPASGLGDMWAYDIAANKWTQVAATGDRPPPRQQAAMAYDLRTGSVVLFGGSGPASDGDLWMDFGDLWQYDSGDDRWRLLDPSGSRPSARSLAQMVFSREDQATFLFGGSVRQDANEGEPPATLTVTDIWSYDSRTNEWTALEVTNQPVPGKGFFLYDSQIRKLTVLFSETTSEGRAVIGMWWCDPATGRGDLVRPAGETPPVLGNMLAVSGGPGRFMLLGGIDPIAVAREGQQIIYHEELWLWSELPAP